MAQLLPTLSQKFTDSNGLPLIGGKIYTYAAGTATPIATYNDFTESVGTENTNPIILDANGEAHIWLGSAGYKFVIKTAADVTLRTVDNVSIINIGSITTLKLADDSVTKEKVNADVAGDGLVQNISGALDLNLDGTTLETHLDIARVKASGITANELATDSVPTSKIVNLNVTTGKLAAKVVTLAKLADEVIAKLAGSFYQNWRYAAPYIERACAFTDAGDVVTLNDHGYFDSQAVVITANTGTTGISLNTVYFVKATGINAFQLASTPGGSALVLSINGTGMIVAIPEKTTWTSIAYGSRNFWVAVASAGTGRTMYSADFGETWIAVTAAEANPWKSVAAGANNFVAVANSGTNRTMYSADRGATWTAVAAAEANPWEAVCWNSSTGTFIAVSTSGTHRVQRSTNNGVSWSSATASASCAWASIAAGGTSGSGTLLAGANSFTGGITLMRSTDNGVTWASVSTSFTINSLTYGNGVWVASSIDGAGSDFESCLYYSTDDGLNWTNGLAFSSAEKRVLDDNTWLSVAYGNGVFMATGLSTFNNRVIVASFDLGLTWRGIAAPDCGSYNCVAYGGGQFMAISDDHKSRVIKSLRALE